MENKQIITNHTKCHEGNEWDELDSKQEELDWVV